MIGRMQGSILFVGTMCVMLGSSGRAEGESLWKKRTPQAAFLFTDTRARSVGDVLTIVVSETTGIDQREERDMEKKTKTGAVFNLKGKSNGNVASRKVDANLDVLQTSDRKFEGKSEFSSDRKMLDRMTVVVVDVLPNGNLVIEGYRRRIISGEERTLRVTGMVRPQDIGANNIVQSQFIANLQLTYEGYGNESSFTGQGWMGRFVNFLWPF
ncbi:MAG: hypothetical protein C4297_04100 [Gemmataceae bacterium]